MGKNQRECYKAFLYDILWYVSFYVFPSGFFLRKTCFACCTLCFMNVPKFMILINATGVAGCGY